MPGTTSLSAATQWLIDWVRGPQSESGSTVTVDTALGFPPVLYAVRKIAGHIGQLPLVLYRDMDEHNKEQATSHPVYNLVKTRPNRYQTAMVFREQMMLHALLSGNGRAAIIRTQGMPVELIPLTPNSTYTCIVDGEKWHVVYVRNSEEDDSLANRWSLRNLESMRYQGSFYRIRDEDVLHIPSLGYNGITGQSLVSLARDAIGLGLAGQTAVSRSFANGSRPGIVLEAPPNMFADEKDADDFINNFNEFHEGLDNIGRAALIREGMQVRTLPMSATDAQWIEQRKFQKQDIALIFGLESMPGEEDSVSYNSLEQKNRAYITNCLAPWMAKWQQECDYKLLGIRARTNHYFRFDTKELVRPDLETTMNLLSTGIRSMIMSPNEARKFLDMNPYDGGDVYMNPAIYKPEEDNAYGDGNEDHSQQYESDVTNPAAAASMEYIVGVEQKRVADAAKSDKPIQKWEKFYAGWVDRLAERINGIISDEDLSAELASAHCRESQNRLIEVSSCVPPSGLKAAVDGEIASWSSRADELASKITSILGDQKCLK